MKKFLTILAAVTLACGLNAMPDREGGKKGGPPDGRPSREEVMKKFDKDGDGKLSESERAELRKAMANRGAPGGRRPPPQLMKQFDKDGDGKLNEEERKAAMAARPKPGEGRPEGKPRGPGGKKGKGKGKKEGGKKKKGDDPEA